MPDIFDTITIEKPKDIFDTITPGGDIFDEVALATEQPKDIFDTLEQPERPNLLVRGLKKLGGSFVETLASVRTKSKAGRTFTELAAFGERIKNAESAGLIPEGSGLKEYLALPEETQDQLAGGESIEDSIQRIQQQRVLETTGWKITRVPEGETFAEKAVDVGAGLAGFISKIALTKKMIGVPRGSLAGDMMSWELVNLADDGPPGAGAAMRLTLGATGKIPAVSKLAKVGKTGVESALFAGIAAAKGGDSTDVIISALIPVAFQGIASTKGRINDVQIVNSWRKQLPFTRDIPLKDSLNMARAMRATYEIRDPKISTARKEVMIRQWEKRFSKGVDTFLKKADTAFKASGASEQPFAQPAAKLTGEIAAEGVIVKPEPTRAVPEAKIEPVAAPGVEITRPEPSAKPEIKAKPLVTKEVTAEKDLAEGKVEKAEEGIAGKQPFEMTSQEFAESKKKSSKFAIEAVTTKKSKILSSGTAETKKALASIEDYLSRIKITETDRLELPDGIFAKVINDLSKEFKISQSEAIARVFDETLTKLSRPEGKKWLEIVQNIQKDIGASDLDAARMVMVGTKGTKFSPIKEVRQQLIRERKQAGGIKKLPPGVKVLSEIMNGPEGEEVSVLDILEISKGIPLPIRTNAELSFRRMAESVGDIRRVHPAWPLTGSKRPTGPNKDVIFEIPEDTVLEFLKNKGEFSFNFQGEKIEVGGSPLTGDQIEEIKRLESEATRLNVDPFAYVWENFLKGFQKSLGVEKDPAEFFWNQAVRMHTQAATRLWEQREALRVKANPELLEKGVSFSKERGRWEAFVNFPESDKRTNLGRFGTKEEAMAARKRALVDRFGKDYSGFDLKSMPRESAWATFAEEKARLGKIDITPKIIILGDTSATQETSFLIEKHSKASYTGKNTAIVLSPGQFPAKPTVEQIIEDKGKEWYDGHKKENIQIVGRTYLDRDNGRLTHEVYSEETGQARALAEEIYHGVFGIIGARAKGSAKEILRWYSERTQYEDQDISEAFAQEMAEIEIGTLPVAKSKLPEEVIKYARGIFSGKVVVDQKTIDVVKSTFSGTRFAIEAESEHKRIVREAVEAGKPVPPEVLAEYPDLAQAPAAEGAIGKVKITEKEELLKTKVGAALEGFEKRVKEGRVQAVKRTAEASVLTERLKNQAVTKEARGIDKTVEGTRAEIAELKKLQAENKELEGTTQYDKALGKFTVRKIKKKTEEIEGKTRQVNKKLRARIQEAADTKGLSKKALSELIKDNTDFTRLRGKVIEKKTSTDQLVNLLLDVESARPLIIGHEKVLTQKTEENIAELRENLSKLEFMNDAEFKRILDREVRGKKPEFIDAKSFITQRQGRDILARMHDTAQRLRVTEPPRRAVEKNRGIKEEIRKIDKLPKKAKDPSRLRSQRFFFQRMGEQSNQPIYEVFLDLTLEEQAKSRERHKSMKLAEKMPDFAKIANDPIALKRVEDWIVSKSVLKEKPKFPEDITENEVRLAKLIQGSFESYETLARAGKFFEFFDKREEMPQYFKFKQGIDRAFDIYNTQGYDALIKYLDTQDWGIVSAGYSPMESVVKKVSTFRMPDIAVGKGRIRQRGLTYRRQDRDILQRWYSYMRQMDQLVHLQPRIKSLVRLVNDNQSSFINAGKVNSVVSTYLDNLKHTNYEDGLIEEWSRRLYSQAITVRVLADPLKVSRNLLQNAAFSEDRRDFLDPRNKKLTPEDLEYLETHVQQSSVMMTDWAFVGEDPLLFKNLTRWVQRKTLYPSSDRMNRLISFHAKINRVRRAFAKDQPLAAKMKDARFSDMQKTEQRVALEILAKDGIDPMARYIAKVHTDNTHFLYAREQRSPAEQTKFGRIALNLALFRRAALEKALLQLGKVFERRTGFRAKVRAATVLVTLLGMSALVGILWKKVTGQKYSPYSYLSFLELNFGGLEVATIEKAEDVYNSMLDIITLDPKKRGKAIESFGTNITKVADYMIPFYDLGLRAIEATIGSENIDRVPARKLREIIDREYKSRGVRQIDRSLVEKVQFTFAKGGGAKKKKTPKPGFGL